MGVKTCIRNGCSSIMCDTYIPSIGYLCKDCIDEFKNSYTSDSEIVFALSNFVDTFRVYGENKEKNLDDFFKQYTNE